MARRANKRDRIIYYYTKKPLSEQYVYYDRLKDYDLFNDYTRISNQANAAKSLSLVDKENDSAILYSMADLEMHKEKAMLEQMFGCNFKYSVEMLAKDKRQSKEFYKELMQLLNTTLNMKQVFERNSALVKETKGQASVMSFFGSYFTKAFEENWPNFKRDVSEQMKKIVRNNQNIANIIISTYDKHISNIMVRAFEIMFTEADVENGIVKTHPELKDAYKELYESINSGIKDINKNPFLKEFYEEYDLDKIKNDLVTEMNKKDKRGVRRGLKLSKSERDAITASATADLYNRKGYSLEIFENKIVDTILEKLEKEKNIKVGAYRTGKELMKADNIYTLGIDSPVVERILKSKLNKVGDADSLRVDNVRRIRKLSDELKKIESGFIIYSSAKNHTFNDGFVSRGGFGAGGQTFKNFTETMKLTGRTINKNFDTIIGAIIQYAEGALLSSEKNQEITKWEEKIAQDVAFMLFDDFDTIGKEMQSNGANSVHIMNLNGNFMPLSLILFLMAQAVETGERQTRGNPNRSIINRYAHVRFHIPKILYETNEWNSPSELRQAWEEQREVMINNAMIEVHFLKNFKQVMQDFV